MRKLRDRAPEEPLVLRKRLLNELQPRHQIQVKRPHRASASRSANHVAKLSLPRLNASSTGSSAATSRARTSTDRMAPGITIGAV
ncbi:MAG TPA: hypothetical protein DGT23_15535 [Micromonosporaceae bacterium]|nr:hypothetical protein [Micromonosporaceae bacterium]